MAEQSVDDKLVQGKRGMARYLLRITKRLLWGITILLSLCFILSNLWMMSPWGTGMAERKVSERLGIDCEISSIMWTPWNGITVNQARVFMPGEGEQAILDVDSIRVKPYWKPLLQRKLLLQEVIVSQPRIELAIEMLAALPADADPIEKPPAIPPALAVNRAQLSPQAKAAALQAKAAQAKVGARATLADYANVLEQAQSGSQVLVQQTPSQKLPAEPTSGGATEVERIPAGPPMRLTVKDGSMRLFSVSKDRDLVNVNQVSIDLPLSGKDADGFIEVAEIDIPGVAELSGFKQKLVWKRPRLEIEEQEVDLGFAKINMRVQLGVQNTQSRLPFLVDMVIRPQQVDSVAWLEERSMHASAGLIAGRFRMLGMLTEPLGWKAEGLFAGEQVRLRAGEGRPPVTFDTVFLPVILQGAQLYWPSMKMLGEDFSILGNGRVSMRGGMVSVTRIVASPEVAEVIEKSLSRAGMVETRWWYDMYTPDRKVRDLIVSGSILNPMIDAGPRHVRLPLIHLLNLIMNPGKHRMEPVVPAIEPKSNGADADQRASEGALKSGPSALDAESVTE
ncbi:MAG: hypothetical protein ACPIA7_05135 [Akkermansiaceae bacterium]